MAMLESQNFSANQKLESTTNGVSSKRKIEYIYLKWKDRISLTG
jgi:hypothetical protein